MENFILARALLMQTGVKPKEGDPVPVEISTTSKDYMVQRVYTDVAANAFGVILGLVGAMIAIWFVLRWLGVKEMLSDWVKSTHLIAENVKQNTTQIQEMRQDLNRLSDRVDRKP